MKHDSNEHKVIDSSLKSILSVTVPMVLTAMSSNFMFVIDRIMLAGYSIDSMNASIISANLVGIFTFMLIGIADSAEVFVGQYNGSKQYEKLAAPAWQMIYMSLASCVILWPMAYFSDYVNTLPHYYLKDGVEFQRILLYFAFLPPLKVAFAAFFIGQGKPKIVTFSIITGAIINVVLCYSFIYGIKNTIPSMGCKGAAIANVISEFISIVILAAVFFNCKNRKIYKTFKNCKFNKGLFFGCARIGVPVSFGNFISMIAWYIVQTLISHTSKDAATIYNVGINVSQPQVEFYPYGQIFDKAFLAEERGVTRKIAYLSVCKCESRSLKAYRLNVVHHPLVERQHFPNIALTQLFVP